MIRYNTLSPEVYREQLFTHIERVEATIPRPYLDSRGIPTMGIGFNLRDPFVRDGVLDFFGINPKDERLTTTAQRAREQEYRDRIARKVAADWKGRNDAALRAALDGIMAERAKDPLLAPLGARPSRFAFDGPADPRIRQAFDQVVEDIFEKRVDAWLPGIPESRERIALVSLAYNGLIDAGASPRLMAAVARGDRAEAWYEIRYNSNPPGRDDRAGIARRRFFEADTFGLYDDAGNVGEDEARGALAMYERRRGEILRYENDAAVRRGLAAALAEFGGTVKTLEAWLRPARERLADDGRRRETAGGDGGAPRAAGAPAPNVTINGLTAVHTGSGGVVKSPDVCRTGGKCRPVTFSNAAYSADAQQTASTVTINGHVTCHKDSIFSRSYGDEPGNCGGVASGTTGGKAEFITFSPNVFIEGRPAVRESDLMTSNNRNTPPMPLMQPGAPTPGTAAQAGADGLDALAAPRLATVAVYGPDGVTTHMLASARAAAEDRQGSGRARLAPLGGDIDDGHPRRRLVKLVADAAGPQRLELLVPSEDDFGDDPFIHLPLGVVEDVAREEADTASPGAMLVPVVPARYADTGRTRLRAKPIREGWLYVFVDGRLWRELEAGRWETYRDVDLAAEAGRDVRRATGLGERTVLVPWRVGAREPEVQVAYSRVQWSWARLEAMSGWAPEARRARERRCTRLPLDRWDQDFADFGDDLWRVDMVPNPPRFVEDRERLPVVCLDDPLGVAWALKDAHLDTVADVMFLAARMEEEDYRLARLVRSLLKAEARASEQARSEGREPPRPVVAESIDRERLEKRLAHWARENRAKDAARKETEAALVAWLKRAPGGGPLVFGEAMADFLEDNIPERRMQGVAILAELLEYLVTREGRDYLRELVTESDAAGLGRVLCNPDDATAQVALRLETGRYHPHGADDGRHLARDAALALMKFGTRAVSSLVSALANASREDDLEHFEWLRKIVARYLPELEVEVATSPLFRLWPLAEHDVTHLYRHQPRLGGLDKRIRVKYLRLDEADVPFTFKALKESLVYKRGFGALVVAVQCINLTSALAQVLRGLREDDPAFLDLAAPLAQALHTATALAEDALGVREALLGSRLDARLEEYRRQTGREIRKSKRLGQIKDLRQIVNAPAGAKRYAQVVEAGRTLNRAREVAGVSSRVLGHLAAWLDVGLKLHNLERLIRTGKGEGAFWQVVELGGMGLEALGISRLGHLVGLVSRLRAAAGVSMVVGAATSEVGVGVAVFLLGLALEYAARLVLEGHQETALERALRYGYFGRQPYMESLLGVDYGPHEVPEEVRVLLPPWVAGPELRVVYGVLFDFGLQADARFLSEDYTFYPWEPGRANMVLWGRVTFSRFLPRRSVAEAEFVIPRPGEAEDRVVRLDEMLVIPREEDGTVVQVDFYWPLRDVTVRDRFTFRVLVDAHGDGQFTVPLDGNKRRVRVHVPHCYDSTNPQQALRMVRARLSPLSFDQMLERDLARRVLDEMDRAGSVEGYDLAGGLAGVRARHRGLLARRKGLDEELTQVLEAEPGGAQWKRLVERFALRERGEEVL